MEIKFDVKPYQGSMDIAVQYQKEEIHQGHFYLNKDFVVNHCWVDGVEYDITDNMESTLLEDFEYAVNKYFLPSFSQIKIEYTGYLTGETGCFPYVREKITPEFSFIRWETFCYPIFGGGSDVPLFDFLRASANVDITLEVQEGFIAVSSADEAESGIENGMRKYIFKAGDNNFAIAIAKYEVETLAFGKFYLLGKIDSAQLESTLTTAHNFMNKHFGARDISSDVNYAAVPNGFGSFTTPKTVFIDTETFTSIKNMSGIIHEFIHLGWNVETDGASQRIRFFDEAYTSYFEMRVMEYLTGENYRLADFINAYKKQLDNYNGDIPISEFGKHEYGDLSYTIGAIFLLKLSEFVGVGLFEDATRKFLQKYRHTPANMEIFCKEYIELCDRPDLEQFFRDWIYTTKGVKSFIRDMEDGK